MEVNIHNAFSLAIKIPIEYGQAFLSYSSLSKRLETEINNLLYFSLQEPLIMTIFTSFVVCSLTMILLIPFLLLIAVFFLVGFIILLEGFLMLLLIAVAIQVKLFIISVITIFLCILSLLKEKITADIL